MLRLRPSELTLTPDDVDETFRRIALRQTSRPRQHLTMQPLGQSGRPVLRRGPQRSTRDAITALGNIPIIQPQQAVFTSVDEEDEHASDHEAAQSTVHDSSPMVSGFPTPESNHGLVAPPVSPVTHTTQLPFRPRSDSLGLDIQSIPDRQVVRTSDSARSIDSAIRSPSVDSATTTSGLRGGGRATSGDNVNNARDATHPPSPLHQMQRLDSPAQPASSGDPTKSPTSPSPDRPTLYLQGYFNQTPNGPSYQFVEHLPRSEPRYSSGRQAPVVRSLSSSAAPSSRVASQGQHHSDNPSDDVFRILPAGPLARHRRGSFNSTNRDRHVSAASDIPHTFEGWRQLHQPSARSRQFSSDATGASSAYSWYGSLPSDTRFPSSARSSQHEASHQLDGAGPSSMGYHSPHPASGFMDLRPPSAASSAYSSPNAPVFGPYGLSPLPSMPYTRNQSDSASSPAAPSHLGQVSGGFVDAATAAVNDLQSPLDAYAEHYQRELQAQHIRPAVPAHANPLLSSVGGSQARRSSQSQNARSSNLALFAPGPRNIVSRQAQHRTLRTQQRSSEHLARSATYRSNISTRSGQPTRFEHRSSENAPVMTYPNQSDAGRHGRVQTQRAAYERLQNPARAMHAGATDTFAFRHSMPQTTSPYDRSNRPRDHAPHHHNEMRPSSPFPMHQSRQPSQSHPHHGIHGGSPVMPRFSPHQGPRPQIPSLVYRPAPGTLRLQPTRDSPLTALAFDQGSGITSRRPHSPLVRTTTAAAARTHRRIPPEQRDQENDGDRALMRREEAGVNARYGEDEQQRSMMNETPPRIGRVERRMME